VRATLAIRQENNAAYTFSRPEIIPAQSDFNSCVEKFVEKNHSGISTACETKSLVLFAQR
jgi:hypothetical protein